MPKVSIDKLTAKLETANAFKPKRVLWKGPEDPGPLGGVTQSILGRYPVCPERFRLKHIEGWRTPGRFDAKIEYGNMWHICEESLAISGNPIVSNPVSQAPWQRALLQYCKTVRNKYPMQQEEINHWYQTCLVQFPIYVQYWSKHRDVRTRTPLLQEHVFSVPYLLPSGRTVFLRGKYDSVDLIGTKSAGIWLQENKSKGDVDGQQIQRQLTFDLQTMLYLVTLVEVKFIRSRMLLPIEQRKLWQKPIMGVRYNVVKRPFSGGKGSIRKHQATKGSKCSKCGGEGKYLPKKGTEQLVVCEKCEGRGRIGAKPEETDKNFYGRLYDIIKEPPELGEDNNWFARWEVEVTSELIEKFKHEFLTPILENLCNDYCFWKTCYEEGKDPFDTNYRDICASDLQKQYYHYRLPFGVYNVLAEGGSTEYDAYLATGNSVGLVQTERLFEELQ